VPGGVEAGQERGGEGRGRGLFEGLADGSGDEAGGDDERPADGAGAGEAEDGGQRGQGLLCEGG
jgi:hypothetical protein